MKKYIQENYISREEIEKAGLMIDSGYGYRYVDIDYCMFCGRRLGE